MRYKIVLKAISNKKLLTLLSEKIAAKEHLPQLQILRELAQGGYVYAANLLKAEAAQTVQTLQKLQIEFAILKDEEELPEKEIFVPKDASEEAPIVESEPKPFQLNTLAHRDKQRDHSTPPPLKEASDKEHHEANLRALYGLDSQPEKKKADPFILLRNSAILLLILGVIWFIAQQTTSAPSRPSRGKMRAASDKSSAKENRQNKNSEGRAQGSKGKSSSSQSPDNPKEPQNAQEAQETKEKADELCGNNGDQATKLYRIALSFNRKNIDAWYGLLNCYKEHSMTKEIQETEAEMRKLFGPHIFSVHKMVSPYGALEEYTDSKSATFLRYSSFDSADPLLDIYKIALSVSNVCKGKKITIYATIGKKEGYLVSIASKPFPRGFGAFKSKASIDRI